MARELPIFPLPVVLFPGAPLPLHIFEPRYRRMLADCLSADRRFGISFTREDRPALGSIGCEAAIRTTHNLPDGRSNLVVTGEDRYALIAWLERDAPYPLARVRPFQDAREETDALKPLARDLQRRFSRLLDLWRELADDPRDPARLTDEPVGLTFQVSAALELEPDEQFHLLSLGSTSERIRRLATLLEPITRNTQRRLAMRRLARANGRAGGPPVLERP